MIDKYVVTVFQVGENYYIYNNCIYIIYLVELNLKEHTTYRGRKVSVNFKEFLSVKKNS